MGNNVRFRASLDDKVSGPLAKIRDNFDRLGTSKGAMTMLTGVGMGAGIAAFNALSEAASAAIGWVTDSIGVASDLRESMSLSAQVFEENTEAVQDWAKGAAAAFGQSEREALNFASNFGTAFKNVGLSMDDTTSKAEEMTRLAADLGSAFNASSEEAATALRSGLLGESEPLRRFGVFLNEAAVKAKAVDMGIAKMGDTLTDAQKVTARYALIMEQTADSQGMFGRDSESLADTQKSLAAEMENVQTEIGTKLLPVMVTLTTWARDELVPTITKTVDGLEDWADALATVATNFTSLNYKSQLLPGALEAIASAEQDATTNLQEMNRELVTSPKAADEWSGGFTRAAKEVMRFSDGTAGDIKRDNAAVKRSYETLSNYLLDDYTDSYDTAMGIIEARSDLHAAETDADRAEAYADLAALGALSAKDYDKWLSALERLAKGTKGKVHEAYTAAIRDIQALKAAAGANIGVKVTYTTPKGNVNQPRASGGPVTANRPYVVGEEGPELFVPRTSGTIVANDAIEPDQLFAPVQHDTAHRASDAVVVHTHLNLDGREIARVVDRHLYYAAARAPRSATAG